MSKKMQVKVNMHGQKCKTKVLKAVTKLTGINEVSVDLAKQMVVVIGDVDPVCVVCQIRKIGKTAEIVSVGPPKKPDGSKTSDNSCTIMYPYSVCTDVCSTMTYGYSQPYGGGGCFFF